jgi:hypothetical protein
VSRYLEILAVQRPFAFNVDPSGRQMFSCNFSAVGAAPVADWEREVIQILEDASLATERSGTTGDAFIGPESTIPTGDGPWIQIIDTGGTAPLETHDGQEYERLSCQVIVRAKSFTVARTRALAIWRELDGKRGVTVTAA